MEFLCRIEMFGQLKVIQADQEQTRFRTHKIGWILAYLALHLHQSVPRERLVDLFWPDKEIEAGRASLNNALSSLRRQLEPPGFPRNSLLIANWQEVRLNASAIHTDVQEFEELVRLAERATTEPERISFLERATSLYRGELLPGCYEEWVGPEQQRLHNLYVDALNRWSTILEQAGDFPNALPIVSRAIKADAFREELYQREMRLYVVLGQPAAALESYQEMERRWQAELGVSPSAATRELAQQIRQDPQSVVLTRTSRLEKQDLPKQQVAPPPASASIENSVTPLPFSLTRFFGRTKEQAQLMQMLQAEDTRLVTLVGTGGVGKTRLALEVARQLGPVFAGRVWWVSLADLPDARLLSSALMRALKLSAPGSADPMEMILERLSESPCLLVLDNFEHLLRDESQASKGDRGLLDTGTILVRFLLERAPQLCCLVTSRLALRLNGEQEFSLHPLPTPVVSPVLEDVLDAPSVSLYVDRARLVRSDFALNANNAESVARLCRQLEGIPLAIEMAAAWARALPPAKMLERLEERLDTLTSRGRDLPARHQSLRATIDWSYDLLDAPQRRLLARLSVFRGGWTLEAAEAVGVDQSSLGDEKQDSAYEYDHPFIATISASDVIDVLMSLVDKSLVVSEEKGDEVRYRLLETVRQYSADRLKESGETEHIQERHYAFFRDMAGESIGKIRGSEQFACLDQLEREHDNIRAALVWARTETVRPHGNPEAELDLAGKIRPFWDIRSYWREGRERLETALQHAPLSSTEIRARALLGAGVLAANMTDFAAARTFYEECLRIRRQLGDSHGVASVAMGLGNAANNAGDLVAAQQWLLESLELARKLDDTWLLGAVLGNLGIVAESQRDYTAQQHYHEESLQLHRKIGNTFGIAVAYSNLGNVFVLRKDFVASYGYMAESLLILRQLGEKRILSRVVCQIAYMEMAQGREATNGVRLMAAGQSILEQIGTTLDKTHQKNMNSARQEIGDEVFAAAFAQGYALSYEQTIEETLTIIRDANAPRTENTSVS